MIAPFKHPLKFNRHEWAGAFGDIGTDLPLLIGMLAIGQLDAAAVLIMFGATQIITGLWYGLPMPVQPLKVIAALVIAHQIPGPVIYGAGLALGLVMLLLTVTRLIDVIARLIPVAVVRGIQFGLGLKLALLSLTDFIARDGGRGYLLASVGFILVVILMRNRRWPASLMVIGLGAVYALFFHRVPWGTALDIGFALPQWHVPTWPDVITGFLVLALPQIPLSLGNSILATSQLSRDLYPERSVPVNRLSLSYALMNIVNALFGGVPVCHGSGGMAGHYLFGGRTGGSVIIYGGMFLMTGLFFSGGFATLVQIFPFPILGVILFFEGLALMGLIRSLVNDRFALSVALIVGILANVLPYGFVIGMGAGTILWYGWKKTAL